MTLKLKNQAIRTTSPKHIGVLFLSKYPQSKYKDTTNMASNCTIVIAKGKGS